MEFAVISCVVENLNQILKEFCKKINIECYFIDNLSPLGIYNKTEDTVGADLLAGAYEAVKLYHLPLVLVDFGTATNITLINENSEITDGNIASVNLWQSSKAVVLIIVTNGK